MIDRALSARITADGRTYNRYCTRTRHDVTSANKVLRKDWHNPACRGDCFRNLLDERPPGFARRQRLYSDNGYIVLTSNFEPKEIIPFVENKPPDWARVQQLMTKSADAGRWANFGPVQSELGRLIYDMIGRPAGKTVIMASSATSALHALVGTYAERAGRPLVWAVSGFGFFSTRIGPLANHVRILDCDRTGLLDLAALTALPSDLWDGLIVTDIFGMQPDFAPFIALCRAAGKPVIVDAAVAFPARRPPQFNASEIISFHHTKPWGFGEGGCMVIDRTQEDSARALLNFGNHLDRSLAPFAANGKMSDAAAALIYQRVETMPRWAGGYQNQRRRIADLAAAEGLSVLVTPPDSSVTPHVPVLAPESFVLADLPGQPFSVAKYYPPLSSQCPVAAQLYSRIAAVPCHSGMADVGDDVLRKFFRGLAKRT